MPIIYDETRKAQSTLRNIRDARRDRIINSELRGADLKEAMTKNVV